ncbi:MAG: uroporphyrinogen decarboxylase family protein [Christensenellaceae bacterium]
MMTKADRVLALFEKRNIDYLPSQISFSDRTRDKAISEALGLDSPDQLDDYLENHIAFTYATDDIPLFWRNDPEMMTELAKKGYVYTDFENNHVYDRWGLGIVIGEDGFFTDYGVLMGDKEKDKAARKVLPERLTKYMDMSFEDAIMNYEIPDPLDPQNLTWYERDKDGVAGDMCIIPSGYFATYERSYALMGWERFMTEMAGNPMLCSCLMEKVTDYRMKLAQVKSDMGFKFAHHGDDLGMQISGFFSPKMFTEQILPHYKRLFSEYKKNGQYIIMHSCGAMIDYLPQLIDIGLDGWEPVQPCNDLKYLKREYGKDLVFWGGIDTQTLPTKTPEEVKTMAREAITILGKGGGHIIAPAQEIMNDVPLENVVALLETIVEMREKAI